METQSIPIQTVPSFDAVATPPKGFTRMFRHKTDGVYYSMDENRNIATIAVPTVDLITLTTNNQPKEFFVWGEQGDYFNLRNNTAYFFQWPILAVRNGGTTNPEVPFGSTAFMQGQALIKNVNGVLTQIFGDTVMTPIAGDPEIIALDLSVTVTLNQLDKSVRFSVRANNAGSGTQIKWYNENIGVASIDFNP